MNNTVGKLAGMARRVSAHQGLPLALAFTAIILMLPALRAGLICDDLIQRLKQLTPAESPPNAQNLGFGTADSGKLGTVVWSLFGYLQHEDEAARAREYGIMPWWTPEDWKAAFWRPVTAFTHWLDYRLFPNVPALMHAHSIIWYALAVFLAALLYRMLATCSGQATLAQTPSGSPKCLASQPGVRTAALAASLFLLDKDTYGPVMYVANRGFIISLVFGLLCLHAHLRWRTSKSRVWMGLSALWLLLALLANEGGASTLAFLMAYALVLEPGGWRPRLISLLPAAAVVLAWRAAYVAGGFGVRHFTGYIDPGYEPWLFLKHVVPRMNALLGGQLTGLPPEVALGLSPKWQRSLGLFFAAFSLVCALVFLPILRRNRAACFWAAVMLLALVPAATVVPLSKNLGFVAVGAFGVIAAFLMSLISQQGRAAMWGPVRAVAWGVAGWLVLAHVGGALAARAVLAKASPLVPAAWEYWCDIEASPPIGGRDLVALNDFTVIMLPFDRLYRGKPLPNNVRLLVPGVTPFEVNRVDASTLVIQAKGVDLFDSPPLGPLHLGYALNAANELFLGGRTWAKGDRVMRKGFMAEIREVSPRGAPREVAFHFDKPLDSDEMVWLYFDWRRQVTSQFVLPRVGETVEIKGPRGWRRGPKNTAAAVDLKPS
jgi:hypothetical protein